MVWLCTVWIPQWFGAFASLWGYVFPRQRRGAAPGGWGGSFQDEGQGDWYIAQGHERPRKVRVPAVAAAAALLLVCSVSAAPCLGVLRRTWSLLLWGDQDMFSSPWRPPSRPISFWKRCFRQAGWNAVHPHEGRCQHGDFPKWCDSWAPVRKVPCAIVESSATLMFFKVVSATSTLWMDRTVDLAAEVLVSDRIWALLKRREFLWRDFLLAVTPFSFLAYGWLWGGGLFRIPQIVCVCAPRALVYCDDQNK